MFNVHCAQTFVLHTDIQLFGQPLGRWHYTQYMFIPMKYLPKNRKLNNYGPYLIL